MRLILACAFLFVLMGCHAAPTEVAVTGGNATGQIIAYTNGAQSDIDRAMKHADPAGKELLAGASEKHLTIIKQATLLEKAFKASVDFGAEWFNCWGAKIERSIIAVAWIVGSILALALAGRIGALFITGPIGAPLAMTSAAVLNMVPGLSHVNTIADNIWFRRASPTAPSKEVVTTETQVTQSTLPPGPTQDPQVTVEVK